MQEMRRTPWETANTDTQTVLKKTISYTFFTSLLREGFKVMPIIKKSENLSFFYSLSGIMSDKSGRIKSP